MMRLFCAIAVLVLAACSESNPTYTSRSLHVSAVAIRRNTYNGLSFRFDFQATGADSARILYAGPGDTGATPWSRLVSGANSMNVLGLLPANPYNLTLQVVGPGGATIEPRFLQATDDLPTSIADARITYSGTPGPGYTLVSPIEPTTPSSAVIAFDSLGRVRWYREFTNAGTLDAQLQRNGHFTVGVTAQIIPIQVGPFVELLPSGDSIATYVAPAGYQTDSHEIVLTGDSASGETAHFFAYDTARVLNLTSIGGPSSDSVLGHTLFRMAPSNHVAFSWDAWSTYGITDWLEQPGATPDFDHPNSLALDADSNYLISFRNMDNVVKLDRQTGAVIWQLGGARSTFTVVNDPLVLFSGQHFVRRLANGHILMYDDGNRHSPPTSRAVEYALDTVAKTATFVWQYLPQPAVFTPIVGSAQRLANGNTVVGFGLASQIDEVDANGHLLARGAFSWSGAKGFYRALRLPSLYRYEAP
jgi:hypothetical protein